MARSTDCLPLSKQSALVAESSTKTAIVNINRFQSEIGSKIHFFDRDVFNHTFTSTSYRKVANKNVGKPENQSNRKDLFYREEIREQILTS